MLTTASGHSESVTQMRTDPRRQLCAFLQVSVLLFLVAFAFVCGCADQPIPDPTLTPGNPKIVKGPFLVDANPEKVKIRFETDRLCVPGVRTHGGLFKVRRVGRRGTQHTVPVERPKEETRIYKLLLDDVDGPAIYLRPRLEPGAPVKLAFLGGGGGDPDALARAAGRLAEAHPDAVLFTGGELPPLTETGETVAVETWQRDFFRPLTEILHRSPLYFLPEEQERVPQSLLSETIEPSPFWSHTFGCVHVIAMDAMWLRDKRNSRAAVAWLERDLDERPLNATWTIFLLRQPLFGAKRVNAVILERLGSLLDSRKVDLVVSGGKYYHRSLPLKTLDSPPVRYVVTGGLGGGELTGLGREYTATLSDRPHICVLDATLDTLDWNVYGTAGMGSHIDSLTVNADGTSSSGNPTIEKIDILSDAYAQLTLRREVLMIARQACKALDDPALTREISFVIANPSARDIVGQLVWEYEEPTTPWTIEPRAIQFTLGAGYEGVAKFTITPTGLRGDNPVLLVNMPGVGSTRQQLIITPKKSAPAYRFDGPVRIDGRLTEKGWSEAEKLEDFSVLGYQKVPDRIIDARVAFHAQGLLIGVQCEAEDPDRMTTRALNRDDKVHYDESVEVFIDPLDRGRDYFQFAVNVRNVALDRSSRLGIDWNPPWEHAVRREIDRYTVEMLIPYRSLGLTAPPAIGTKWGFNLTRNDYHASRVDRDEFEPDEEEEEDEDINIYNLGEAARRDLGPTEDDRKREEGKKREPEPRDGPAFEVIQWARTLGSNGRSGLYGDLVFSDKSAEPPAEEVEVIEEVEEEPAP